MNLAEKSKGENAVYTCYSCFGEIYKHNIKRLSKVQLKVTCPACKDWYCLFSSKTTINKIIPPQERGKKGPYRYQTEWTKSDANGWYCVVCSRRIWNRKWKRNGQPVRKCVQWAFDAHAEICPRVPLDVWNKTTGAMLQQYSPKQLREVKI